MSMLTTLMLVSFVPLLLTCIAGGILAMNSRPPLSRGLYSLVAPRKQLRERVLARISRRPGPRAGRAGPQIHRATARADTDAAAEEAIR